MAAAGLGRSGGVPMIGWLKETVATTKPRNVSRAERIVIGVGQGFVVGVGGGLWLAFLVTALYRAPAEVADALDLGEPVYGGMVLWFVGVLLSVLAGAVMGARAETSEEQ